MKKTLTRYVLPVGQAKLLSVQVLHYTQYKTWRVGLRGVGMIVCRQNIGTKTHLNTVPIEKHKMIETVLNIISLNYQNYHFLNSVDRLFCTYCIYATHIANYRVTEQACLKHV